MFDNLITRITSPATARRRHTYHCPEVHSDPEDNEQVATPARKPRILERRRKGRRAPEHGLRQARSLGRLDGLKEAERLADYGRLLGGSQPMLDGRRKDLDRIQDLFPHDYLALHALEPSSSYHVKSKSFRKKSLSDLRSLTDFNKNTTSNNNSFSIANSHYSHQQLSSSRSSTNCSRTFLVEAPCAIALPSLPLTAKPRHLFLFSDLLLVAKPRNAGFFKLKECVRVSEIWLAACPESDTGFLLGWPNPARTLLVRFCTQAARDSWWRTLQQALAAQLRLEPPVTNIKVVYRDPLTGTECSKTLGVGPEASTGDIARLAFDDNRTKEWGYTLWTRDRDSPPSLLLGCERPHSIQLARLRQSLCTEEGFDLAHCNNNRVPCDIVFEVKPNCKPTPRKVPLKLFRKNSGRIFGVPLSRLYVNNSLPSAITTTLKTLYQRGPQTQGIFRRCASARALRELRERVDAQGTGVCEEITSTTPLLLAVLLKDFLRSLPEPLLLGGGATTPADWLAVVSGGRPELLLRRLLSQLPPENHTLLAHVIAVLANIARRERYNLMSAANLGVCLGPSLLWEAGQNAPMRTLPTLVEILINNCQMLFGTQIMTMLGEVANDSGAEESDSLHSLGLSLDSNAELSKDQKSLSRDSGLTLSEDDRDSPALQYSNALQPSRTPSNNNTTSNSSSSNNSTTSAKSSPVPNPLSSYPFHRSDWARQAARVRSLDTGMLAYSQYAPQQHHGSVMWLEEEEEQQQERQQQKNGEEDVDEAFGASSESLCGPPVPPRRSLGGPGQALRHLPPVHLPPLYRPPPPPPPSAPPLMIMAPGSTYHATARLLLVTDAESESYV